MTMRRALSVAAAILASTTGFAQAGTIFVDPTGDSSEFVSIQQALDIAERGDEIVLGPGLYKPAFDLVPGIIAIDVATIEQDDLIIRSSHGPDVTIIDGSDRYRGINGKSFGSSLRVFKMPSRQPFQRVLISRVRWACASKIVAPTEIA